MPLYTLNDPHGRPAEDDLQTVLKNIRKDHHTIPGLQFVFKHHRRVVRKHEQRRQPLVDRKKVEA